MEPISPVAASRSLSRGVLNIDPFIANTASSVTTPPSSLKNVSTLHAFSENRCTRPSVVSKKGHPISTARMEGAKIAHCQWTPSTPVITNIAMPDSPPVSPFVIAVDLPPSPTSPDVSMVDAYTTPPTQRTLPSKYLPMSRDPPPSLAAQTIHMSTLATPTAPPTPPLTPPYANMVLPAPIATPTPPPKIHFPTASSRALYQYPLHPIFRHEYEMHEELGCGGFGFVVRASRRSDGLNVAVKFIEREKIQQHGWASTTEQAWRRPVHGRVAVHDGGRLRIPMEAYVLAAINLDGVVAFIDLFEDARYFYLVMEHHGSPWQKPPPPPPVPMQRSMQRPVLGASLSFTAIPTRYDDTTPTSSPLVASNTLPISHLMPPPRPTPMMRRSSCDLFECIEQNAHFDEDKSRYVFAQVVEVVYQLGLMGICHRDIKDENIVITSDFKVKVIDFGSAVIFNPNLAPPVYTRFYGTTAFASAEILRGETYEAPSSEIWSLGVLLSILLTGECPFANTRAAAEGQLSSRRVKIGWEAESLMLACLEVDVPKRITIEQIRNHHWLRGSLSSASR